jgi:hypothetical protein
MIGMPNGKFPLTSARRRALTVLAGAADGYTHAAMMAHGLSLEFLTDLVREGLASERGEWVMKGKREAPMVRLSISDVGRDALGL